MFRTLASAIYALLLLAFSYSAKAEVVALKNEAGNLVVPVLVNDEMVLGFIIDSGASDVSIPADVFSTLLRAGAVVDADMIDIQRYKLADGSEYDAQRFRIRSLRVGNVEIHDVIGSVTPTSGELLLGRSFLSKLDAWSIDNGRHLLLLNESRRGGRPSGAGSGIRVAARQMAEPGQSAESFFHQTLAYLLTGDYLGNIRIVDRADCIVETRHRIWPEAPDLVSIIHLNKVERDLSSIRAVSDIPKNRVDITLRGEGVVEYLERPAFKSGNVQFPAEPAHGASEDTITLYTDDVERVRRAWDYVYSNGCRGSKSAF